MEWAPTPKQEEFLSATEEEVFFGGAAGPGKTTGLLIFQILRRQQIPGSRGLFLRRTFPELDRSVIPQAQVMLHNVAKWESQHYRFRFPNGSILEFGHVQEEKDLLKYQSAQYEDICFDELTSFMEEQYLFLFSRCRTALPGVVCYMRSASNPGGPGHGWVKKRFVDPAPPNTPFEVRVVVDGRERVWRRRYIPATLQDNPYLSEQYRTMLAALPEHLRRMYELGDWDATASSAFPEFRRDVHVVEPFEVPDGWTIWRGFDRGFSSPFCCLWLAQDPDGRRYVVDELYGADRDGKGLRMDATDVAALIRQKDRKFGRQRIVGYADPECWTKQDQAPSWAEKLNLAGCNFVKAVRDRVMGWMEVHHNLRVPEGGEPVLRIFSTCRNLIRQLMTVPPSPADPDDVDTQAEDHALDALRYALMAYPLRPKVVVPETPYEAMLRRFGGWTGREEEVVWAERREAIA
ncbi:MAG: hypothetical protein H5U04_11985 [Firmicutes bacterium]|nr:hypothetical protein [Bacillota bacterium]